MGIRNRWTKLKIWWNKSTKQNKIVRNYYNRKKTADLGKRSVIAGFIGVFMSNVMAMLFCCELATLAIIIMYLCYWWMMIGLIFWVFGNYKNLEYLDSKK